VRIEEGVRGLHVPDAGGQTLDRVGAHLGGVPVSIPRHVEDGHALLAQDAVAILWLSDSPGMKTCTCGNPSMADRRSCSVCYNRALRERYARDATFRAKKRAVAKRTFTPEKRRAYWADLKVRAFEVLGGPQCRVCGFDDARALQIDHVDGLGHLRRKEHAETGRNLYTKVIQNNGRGYQVLCANCNWIKRWEEGNRGGPPKITPPADGRPETGPAVGEPQSEPPAPVP